MKPAILVPFDFSVAAKRALAWAADLQRTTGGPPIRVVHAINTRPAGTGEAMLEQLVPSENEIRALEQELREEARRVEATVTPEVRLASSSPADILLDAARDAGADLVVMGSHGRTGVTRLLLGSVAEHVLRHAACPVVVLRAP